MVQLNSEALKRIRKQKGYAQAEFANVIDMKLSTYAYKEKIGQFDEKEFETILKSLDISKELVLMTGTSFATPVVSQLIAGDETGTLVQLISTFKSEIDSLRKQNESILSEMRDRQAMILAYTKTLFVYQARIRSVMEKKSLKEVKEEMNKMLDDNLQGILKAGT